MKANFPIRTGSLSYKIPLDVPTTGNWSVSLGFSGISENTWNMSGVSGKIYDNTGYMIGTYPPSQSTMLSGSIFENYHSIYQDGVLLSNCSPNIPNDYDTVSVHGNYIGGLVPSVQVEGQNILNKNTVQTHQFWKNENDRIYFVTENTVADKGFIDTISGMGIEIATGTKTDEAVYEVNSGARGGSGIDEFYNVILFGAATTSGAYNSGVWNSLNSSMMSLNSYLVCPENLNWYGSDSSVLVHSSGYQTGVVFPQQYRSPANTPSIWAEFPTQGWFKLFRTETSPHHIYYPYDLGGLSNNYVKFELDPGSSPNTIVRMHDGEHETSRTFAGDIRPFGSVEGLENELELTFTDVADAPDDVIVKLSNTLGGTGAVAFTWTGTSWGKRQVNSGRVVPQTASYDVDTVFRHSSLTSGNYPTEKFSMYRGEMSAAHGMGGDTLIGNMDTGKVLTAFHKGFWTGNILYGDFTKNNMVVFSVTPTGTGWVTGQNMWNTLTSTGKRLFVNSVAEMFLSAQR